MKRDMIGRYIWLYETIKTHGYITREEINRLWIRSAEGDGKPFPARTFFHLRRALEHYFKVEIECTPAHEYYINAPSNLQNAEFRGWLADSFSMRELLADAASVADRILVDKVADDTSEVLKVIVKAMKQSNKLTLSYQSYTRINPDPAFLFHPYFVKFFRQRWYVIGYKEKDNSIRTYALDRIVKINIKPETFRMPDYIDPATFFDDYFGITINQSLKKKVVIQATRQQAKYFRALPLHRSQREELHDHYSLFTYQIKITDDFVRELLSYGGSVKVLYPIELATMMKNQLRRALAAYGKGGSITSNDSGSNTTTLDEESVESAKSTLPNE